MARWRTTWTAHVCERSPAQDGGRPHPTVRSLAAPRSRLRNRIQGPASKLPHDGFERPSHCAFGPDDALYVTDFGEIDIAPEKEGIRIQAGTGTLWRIRRDASTLAGDQPPEPVEVPFYLAQYALWIAGLAALLAAVAWGIRRLVRR
ncbi:MAG: hypothetical protein M3O99_11360 [Chloroflexota bacterium]|nr:hypothetical protein [Chloroflexota bacterium]